MKLSKRELHSMIDTLVDGVIDEAHGEFDVVELGDVVLAKVSAELSGDRENYAELFSSLVGAKVRSHVRRRSIERRSDDKTEADLFPEDLAQNVLMIDERSAIRVKYATLRMFEAAHDRRRDNTAKQIAAVEKWEERLTRLRELGMAANPTMTFEDAMIRARAGSFSPPLRSSGPEARPDL